VLLVGGTSSKKVWNCFESVDNRLSVFGSDTALMPRDLQIVISVIPSHGVLVDPSTMNALRVGDSLSTRSSYPYTGGVEIIYRPHPTYFNAPTTTWNGSTLNDTDLDFFSYHVRVGDANTLRSADTVEELFVTNVNNRTSLRCPTQLYTVSAIGTLASGNETALDLLDRVYIAGFGVDDVDRQVDLIRATVSANYGFVSLNQNFLSGLDFNSATFCLGDAEWRCSGSGTSDDFMTFVGTPADIAVALEGMRYQSYAADVDDVILVQLYDGAGDQCIPSNKFKTASVRKSCLTASCSIAVKVAAASSSSNTPAAESRAAGLFGLPKLPLQAWVGVCAATLLMLAFACKWIVKGRSSHALAHESARVNLGIADANATVGAALHVPQELQDPGSDANKAVTAADMGIEWDA
jgi:hypothetical protein